MLPMPPLIVVAPVLVPIWVTIPVLLIAPDPEPIAKVSVPLLGVALLLLKMVRLFMPVTPPLKVTFFAPELIPKDKVPVVPCASSIALLNTSVGLEAMFKVALAVPLLLPIIILPVPKVSPVVPEAGPELPMRVPAKIVVPPV